MAYWYNVNTGAVEQGEETNPKSDMLGPYSTEAEAREAISSAHARSEAWDAEERRFNGDD